VSWSKVVATWSQGNGVRGVKGEATTQVRKGVPVFLTTSGHGPDRATLLSGPAGPFSQPAHAFVSG
jgi:Tfp pilus assembly PilM family ATPase